MEIEKVWDIIYGVNKRKAFCEIIKNVLSKVLFCFSKVATAFENRKTTKGNS